MSLHIRSKSGITAFSSDLRYRSRPLWYPFDAKYPSHPSSPIKLDTSHNATKYIFDSYIPCSKMVSALQSQLFPPSQSFISGFTTSSHVDMAQISHVALSDSALGVTKVSAGTDHPVVPGPDTGENAWEATYPEGSYSPSSGTVLGGFGFYLVGPESFSSQLSSATAVLTSYSVRFEEDWEWQLGGKLPGQCELPSVLHVVILVI